MKALSAAHYIKTAQVTAPNGKTMKLDWAMFSYNSKRIDFDTYLFNLVKSETPTTLLEGKRLRQVTITDGYAACQFADDTCIQAALVIACDGANSVVKRNLAKGETGDAHLCSAVRAYYKDVEGVQAGVNEFYFFSDFLPGYFWIFPLEDGWVNVGFGVLQKPARENKNPVNLRHTLQQIIDGVPSIASRFRNATLLQGIKGFGLPLGIQQNSISGTRFMLCGDAAALIDPLQGHGIDHAMTSGHLAGLQALKCFQAKQFDAAFMKQYDQAVYGKIGAELSRNTFLLRLLSRFPWLLSAVTTVGQNQELIEKIVRFLRV